MLGFTQNEQRFILFLCVCLVVGSGIRMFQNRRGPLPQTDRKPVTRHSAASYDSLVNEIRSELKIRIDVNRAGEVELQQIPGIGPSLAKKIFEYREKNGPFATPDALLKVKGIGPGKLKIIHDYITVNQTSKRNTP